MNLRKQVSNLELSKKLKELGVPQDGLWWWENHELNFKDIFPEAKWRLTMHKSLYDKVDYISAFTVAELGEMLPYRIQRDEDFFYFQVGQSKPNDKNYSKWEISYSNEENVSVLRAADTEADARAKGLIYLIQNNLIDVRKI